MTIEARQAPLVVGPDVILEVVVPILETGTTTIRVLLLGQHSTKPELPTITESRALEARKDEITTGIAGVFTRVVVFQATMPTTPLARLSSTIAGGATAD